MIKVRLAHKADGVGEHLSGEGLLRKRRNPGGSSSLVRLMQVEEGAQDGLFRATDRELQGLLPGPVSGLRKQSPTSACRPML